MTFIHFYWNIAAFRKGICVYIFVMRRYASFLFKGWVILHTFLPCDRIPIFCNLSDFLWDINIQIGKVCTIENNTNSNSIFCLTKSSKNWFYFFTCTLPDYVAHEITKEFWKNNHFEKITAGFLLRFLDLRRWNTPKMMDFQAWNFLFSPILPL